MANLALYRKYRPRTFDELKGQEHVTAPLIQALKNGKLNHAYLFSGPRGCGKTSSARILARSLNCVNGPTPDPCGECGSCVALAPDGPGSLDVIEIDAASHGGVDDARDLRERAFFAPVSSRFKVYVIDEAHMVSPAGFNALLKLVEEPPDFVKFVFATTEPDKVLQTIRSRTHHYPFRLVPPGVLRTLLEDICEKEKVTVESTVFPLVVRAGGGSVRDSLSILDQLLAGAGDEGVTYATAVRLLGVTDIALLDEACDALAAADGAALFATVDRVVEAGHEPRRFASDLLERLRDLLILEKVPDAAGKGLIDVPADQLERMVGQALRLGGASLSRMADVVHNGLVEMRGTTSPRLLLELVCARMLLPGADDSQSALLQRLERLERRFDIAGQPAPATTASPAPARPTPVTAEPVRAEPVRAEPTTPAPVEEQEKIIPATDSAPEPVPAPVAGPPAAVETPPVAEVSRPVPATPEPVKTHAPGEIDAAAVRRLWGEILERVKKRRVVWSLMQNATPRSVEGTELVLVVQHQGLVRRFADDQVVRLLQEALHEVLGVRWTIRAVADGGPGGGPGGSTSSTGGSAPRRAPEQQQRPEPRPADPPAERQPLRAVEAPRQAASQPAAAQDDEEWPAVRPVLRSVPDAPEADDVPLPPPPADEYGGFDPGDEPEDEPAGGEADAAPRRDPGAEAIAVLQRTFEGARKIGDV
ncbi:MAG: polymerase subunit gamma/tau [Cryptosporangiaceae bacterium]|nr:polymerase subunit gamma/tau [Cryptosporangiaceae bacterium]